MIRIFAVFAVLFALVGCSVPTTPVDEPLVDLGDFVLGHNIAVTKNLTKGPLSREGSPERWEASVESAVDARLGRYDGERLVHLGINVAGYVLAQPGVPVLMAPKSALILTVTAWDDQAGKKFNAEPKEIIVLETFTGSSLLGSGYTMRPEEQMANLSYNAAKAIEEWLHENRACLKPNPSSAELAACWKDNKDSRSREALENQ
ncbi:hypothetical protein Q8W37_06970 [Shimia thalassica]|jgi:hypothetical protein|uniref:DUF3313 domain-containing protein n=1 Tax=Shimia thalassica TaxID=1715693 RepID=A0A0P1I149_9RHOB|nr:hypothetical protein [Shimia thalassica]PHO05980.1 hypothetical protein CSC82_01135 [Rhodobacteraceae bacterium 4F10]MDO6484071.1 hypothetical protein [Shimia thalassica]MDO6522607.1 hypothetical protein [Shimia thalassica]MDO6798921.1 hypothetical protein [Shimia thalassica]MDP2494514.1 hypothetical protein [Shimia thalassica]